MKKLTLEEIELLHRAVNIHREKLRDDGGLITREKGKLEDLSNRLRVATEVTIS